MSRLNEPSFWEQYHKYLLRTTCRVTTSDRIQYAKRYHYVLASHNADDLLSLSNEKRLHAMKALSKLSKYLGQYQNWLDIKERYQLKWTQEDSLSLFKNMMNSDKNYSGMVHWVTNVTSVLPKEYGNIILFCTLTGLRPSEACESIRLINIDCDQYLNKELMILEHFRYPELFIRRTKKEYISIVTPEILSLAKNSKVSSYNAIKLFMRKKGISMNMAFCRKIFATHLRTNGIESETIDLLQGRIPKSVFVRHYFRPDLNNSSKIRKKLEILQKQLAKR